MVLDDFIGSKVKTLMDFQSRWRQLNTDKPNVFPMDNNIEVWEKQLSYFKAKEELENLLEQINKTSTNANAA